MEWASIRQYFYSSHFRIARSVLPDDAAVPLVTAILNGESTAKGALAKSVASIAGVDVRSVTRLIDTLFWKKTNPSVPPFTLPMVPDHGVSPFTVSRLP